MSTVHRQLVSTVQDNIERPLVVIKHSAYARGLPNKLDERHGHKISTYRSPYSETPTSSSADVLSAPRIHRTPKYCVKPPAEINVDIEALCITLFFPTPGWEESCTCRTKVDLSFYKQL